MNQHLSINCGGALISFDKAHVMGILNVTPDSFYDGGRYETEKHILLRTEQMLSAGATFIDIGGMSSRPGANIVSVSKELDRVLSAVKVIKKTFPEALLSIDSIHSEVVRQAIGEGAVMINDISAGSLDPEMFQTVAELGVPYVLMHMQGKPATMQQAPQYKDVSLEVLDFFIQKIGKLRQLKVKDIIIDPGFGFGKTVEHNYELLKKLHVFHMLDCPILVGMSRKSMFCKLLGIKPANALNATTAAHVIALQQGARILRVHDVKEAVEAIRIVEMVG